jgi:hypothetical protein
MKDLSPADLHFVAIATWEVGVQSSSAAQAISVKSPVTLAAALSGVETYVPETPSSNT